MADEVLLALVGTGGMARRYLRAFSLLDAGGSPTVRLAALCGRTAERVTALADEATALLGTRPQTFTDLAALAASLPHVDGAVVVTNSGSHHAVAVACLEAGLHVLVEKPLALTVRGCNLVIGAAQRWGRVLSVAENYRRDPMNRLAAALIAAGAIGTPRLMIESRIGGAHDLFITPWRHQKLGGTVVLDTGVHNADILQYYLGPVHTVYGEGRLFEAVRYPPRPQATPGTHASWTDFYAPGTGAGGTVAATGEDALFGHLHFESGAIGQWTFHYAAHAPAEYRRVVYGSQGTLIAPGDRNGRPIILHLAGGREVAGAAILDHVPDYHLDPPAAALFGAARPWRYDLPFAEVDARLLALELIEFGACIAGQAAPEVDGAAGRRDVALVNAVLESGRLGRAVTLAEVEQGDVDTYQREIDAHYGLI
jgi:predicted dehydrogenase